MISFRVSISSDSSYYSAFNNGPVYNKEIKARLGLIKPGDKLVFDKIYVRLGCVPGLTELAKMEVSFFE